MHLVHVHHDIVEPMPSMSDLHIFAEEVAYVQEVVPNLDIVVAEHESGLRILSFLAIAS